MMDPDGEKVGVQFAAAWVGSDGVFKRRWWSTGSEGAAPSSSAFKASGSLFSTTLPSAVPVNALVGWEVRGWDGAEWGPWSSSGDAPTDCYFKVDTTIPAGPTLASPSFPGASDAQADLPWTDGVGKYGTFTFATTSTDVVTYQYALDQDPSAALQTATTGGAARSVNLLMLAEGPHWVSARALDAAGNASEPSTYYFNVLKGQPQRGGWSMDSAADAKTLAASSGNLPATLHGAVTAGVPGHSGTAISLPGTGDTNMPPPDYAATEGAVLDTDKSFTVSAWVTTTDTSRFQAAVSQSGQHATAISLGLYGGKWTVSAPSADSKSGVSWYTARSEAVPVANQWTHLAAVYDATAKTLTLYVNGTPSTPVTGVTLWAGRGTLNFGRTQLSDTAYGDGWKGSLDDIRVWDRAMGAADVSAVKAGTAVPGLGAKSVWSMDDTGRNMAGRAETGALSIKGGVQTGIPGVTGEAGGAVRFDGTTGYAVSDGPQIDATRSFAVSAWVKLAATPAGGDQVVVAQTGQHNAEFTLYYSTAMKSWAFGRYQTDASNAGYSYAAAGTTSSTSGPFACGECIGLQPTEWTHLVGVSDPARHELRLYINGFLAGLADYTQTAAWPEPGPVRVGTNSHEGLSNSFLNGDVDDVRIFDRVVTGKEAKDMVQQRPRLQARWKFDTSKPPSPGEPTGAPGATLYGSAVIDTTNSQVSTGALGLDATGGYAQTTSTPLNTGQSFTVAGWAQTAGAPHQNMTVLSLGDSTTSAITVRWNYLETKTDPDTHETYNTGQWQVETVDGARRHTTAVHTFVAPSDVNTRWNHLAVTYDSFSGQLALYVNGQLQNEVCDPEAPAGTCTDHISFVTASQPFTATSGLQFGRSVNSGAPEEFSGQIDDVWAYQGVLSPAQIAALAGGTDFDTTTGPS